MAKKAKRKKTGKKKAATTAAKLSDYYSSGELTFCIDGGESGSKTVTVDLVMAKIAADELELKHRLDDQGGRPTRPFLADLAIELSEIGNFACTPSVAYQIWHAVDQQMAILQKKTN